MPDYIMNDEEIQQAAKRHISDHTGYMRWSTEIEQKDNVTTADFLERNNLLIMASDKFTPQANFQDPRMIVLHKVKIQAITLAKNAGLYDTAEETALSVIDDVQCSRGDKGFFTTELNKQRHELVERRTSEPQRKVGFINRLFGGKQPEQQQMESQQR